MTSKRESREFRAGPASLFLTAALSLALVAACQSRKPDLERLYRSASVASGQPPVVLVHGILGSRLAAPEGEVWPGGWFRVLFSDYRQLQQLIDPRTVTLQPAQLQATTITDRAAGRDFYGAALRTLRTAGQYLPARLGDAVSADRRYYYVFVYDWRQDNAVTARRFDAFIEHIRRDHGQPDLQVDVVAHSMGGLMLRYFLRYGGTDVLNDNAFPVNSAGAKKVRRAILLGTPNLGSVSALQGFIDGVPVGFDKIPTEVLATMPSVYQLLPHPLNDWIVDGDGEPLQRDLFDVGLWRRFQWSIFNPQVRSRLASEFDSPADAQDYLRALEAFFERHLERARRFVWSLTVPLEEVLVQPIVFGGDCDLTPARILVEEIGGESVVRLWPNEIRNPNPAVNYDMVMLEPGDGTVTKASLLAREALDPGKPRHQYSFFPMDYSFFLCADHSALTGNVHFQDNLLHALLSID